jgi:hypothetical protein
MTDSLILLNISIPMTTKQLTYITPISFRNKLLLPTSLTQATHTATKRRSTKRDEQEATHERIGNECIQTSSTVRCFIHTTKSH